MTSPTLKSGQRYLIKQLNLTADQSYRRKLIAIGMVPGTQFKIQRMAPFGGPVQLELNGSLFCLRRKDLSTSLKLEALES